MNVFSYSRIDKIENGCPFDWFGRYYWHLREPESIPTETGHIVHEIGRQFVLYLLAGGDQELASVQKKNRKEIALVEFAKATLLSKSSFDTEIYPMVNTLCNGIKIEDGWSYYPEYEFFLPMGTGDESFIYLGFIDLLAISPDGKTAIIDDYKTNRVKYDVLDTMQIPSYALVIKRLFPQVENIIGNLQFLRFKETMSEIITQDIMDQAEAWVFDGVKDVRQRLPLGINGFEPKPCSKCENCWNAIRCPLAQQKIWPSFDSLTQTDVDYLAARYIIAKQQASLLVETIKSSGLTANLGDRFLGTYADESIEYNKALADIFNILAERDIDPLTVMSIDKNKLGKLIEKQPSLALEIFKLGTPKTRNVFDLRPEPPALPEAS